MKNSENRRPRPGFLLRLLDLLMPRVCVACGERLSVDETLLCTKCNLHLPRTYFWQNPEDNVMARMLWGLMPVVRCGALFYYLPRQELAHAFMRVKYLSQPQVGVDLGHLLAQEYESSGFFEGIDALLPVPLAANRFRQRGYNQSERIATGISEVTGLPVLTGVVRRDRFVQSQTHTEHFDRAKNVENTFHLVDAAPLQGRHVLLIDDVMTTGATMIAFSQAVRQAPDVVMSVLTVGFTKG